MKEMIKLGLILLLITAVAASLLGVTYDVTYAKIVEQRKAADDAARAEVFPTAESFEEVSADQLDKVKAKNGNVASVYKALSGGEVIGFVVKTIPSGFGGPVEVVVGISKDGTISGFRMGNHAETPGLGDNAKKPYFYEQYEGLTVTSPVGVNKVTPGENEIQAIAGATITSQAVTDGVNFVGDIFDLLEE